MTEHGNYLTYIHHRCRCDHCRTAWNVWNQRNKLRHQRGETVSVDRAVVRAHILDLQDRYGATAGGIAKAAGYGNNQAIRNALDATKTRPVPASAARRIMSVEWATLPDTALVWARFALEHIDRIHAAGGTNADVARRLGWTGWPGNRWPRDRVRIGHVRVLQAYADDLDGRCEDCDQPGWGGGRWCWTHYSARAKRAPARGCGTDAGYTAHRREGTDPCPACREAHHQASRLRRAS